MPDAAGPITVSADLRTTQIRTSIDVQAPQEGTLPRRVSWLSKQLKDAPDTLLVEVHFDPRPETTCERFADIRDKPGALIPGKEWEPTSSPSANCTPWAQTVRGPRQLRLHRH